MSGQILKFVTADGERYQVSIDFANLSEHVKRIIEDESVEEEIPMPKVDSQTFKLVIEYAEHHSFQSPELIKSPLDSNVIDSVVKDPWDAEFINRLDTDRLLDLIFASNYLHIDSLFSLCCAYTACLFKGKDLVEVGTLLGLEAVSLTSQQEEYIKQDNGWALEDSGNRAN